jgi:hypothetical protein
MSYLFSCKIKDNKIVKSNINKIQIGRTYIQVKLFLSGKTNIAQKRTKKIIITNTTFA